MAVAISTEQLKQARQDGAMVIDARDDNEYAAEHISGAASLALSEVETRMQELPKTGPLPDLPGWLAPAARPLTC